MTNDPRSLLELRAQFFAHLRAANRSERTISHYNDTFKDLLRFLEARELPPLLASLTTQTCQEFSTWLMETPTKVWRGKTERSIFGINGRLRDLAAFMSYLEKSDLLTRRVRVPTVKLPETEFAIFTDQDLIAIFSTPHLAAKGDQAVRNRAIVALFLDTGVRLGEIAGITLEDVEFDDQLVRVTGKGRKTRRVPFSGGTRDYLLDWLRVRGKEAGSFFQLSYHGIRMMLRRVETESEVKNIHPHRFRHTTASKLVRSGVDVASVRRIMGHAHISTTLLYVHQNAEDLRVKHNAASPLENVTALLPSSRANKRRRLEVG